MKLPLLKALLQDEARAHENAGRYPLASMLSSACDLISQYEQSEWHEKEKEARDAIRRVQEEHETRNIYPERLRPGETKEEWGRRMKEHKASQKKAKREWKKVEARRKMEAKA